MASVKWAWLGAALVLAGCAAAQGGDDESASDDVTSASALDVNDVSFLFPLPAKSADVNQLPGLDMKAANGPLLSADNFTKLVSYALNRYVPPAGVTTTYAGEKGGGEYAVRAFGYLGRDVNLTEGVVNSSAAVIKTINASR